MKRLLLISLLSIFSIISASAQFFKWAQKQENGYVNNAPTSPFQPFPMGGNFLATGSNFIAKTGLFNQPITLGNQTFTNTDAIDAYLAVYDNAGNTRWAKQISGGTSIQPSIAIDQNQNIIISGYYQDSLNIDGLLFRASTASKQGIYIVKFNAAGTLLWARSSDVNTGNFQSGLPHTPVTKTDGAGNIYIAGIFGGTLTFNGTNLNAGANLNIFLAKFSGSGAFQRISNVGSTNLPSSPTGINMEADAVGNIFLSYTYTNAISAEHKITKVNSAGNISWSKTLTNSGTLGIDITLDNAANTYLSGYFPNQITIGNFTLSALNGGCFLAKLDAAGNWKWARNLASGLNSNQAGILITVPKLFYSPENYLGLAGYCSTGTQFTGSTFTPASTFGTFIMKTDTAGTLTWVNAITSQGGNNYSTVTDLSGDANGNLFLAGMFYGNLALGNLMLTVNGQDASYLTKIMDEANMVTGTIFMDANFNGIFDAGETTYNNLILGNPQLGLGSMAGQNGTYMIYLPNGTSVISPYATPRYYNLVPASHSVTFTGTNQTQTGKDFALQPIPNSNDVKVTVSTISAPRPGSTFRYRITYYNAGTTTLADTIGFTHNTSDLTFVTTSTIPLSQQPGKITWAYQNLQPYETRNIDVTFSIPANSVLGTPLTAIATIKPLAIDLFQADNQDTLKHTIVGSFDPNDKQVDKPFISPAAATNGEFLDYTIRFQNTGTDTAFTVIITDKINTKLDLTKFEMLSASHNYQLGLNDNNQLEWRFENILLPHSTRNEPASHGFIRFRIKSKPGLVLGDSITNNAAIYFDFNAPVITNYAVTKVGSPTGINKDKAEVHDFKLYPNPASNFVTIASEFKKPTSATVRLVNMLGQTISEVALPATNQLQYQLPVSKLAKGVYIIQLETQAGRQTQRLVVQ